MKTLNSIQLILKDYIQRAGLIHATSQNDYDKQLSELQSSIRNDFNMLRDVFPQLLQINYSDSISGIEAEKVIDNIKNRVADKYVAEYLPGTSCFVDHIGNDTICTPSLLEWQHSSNNAHNFVINYNNTTKQVAEITLNSLLLNMLLSLAPGYIHLDIVDVSLTGLASNLTKGLGNKVCGELITSQEQFLELLECLRNRFVNILNECGDLCRYNIENKICKYPYEIVVLLNYPNQISSSEEKIIPLFENGYKGGVYFVVLNNLSTVIKEERDRESILSYRHSYQEIEFQQVGRSSFVNITPIYNNKSLLKSSFEYLSNTFHQDGDKQNELSVKDIETEKLFEQPYEDTISNLIVPIGNSEDSLFNFQFDISSHSHAFVIGKTRSGKSVLLHSIITSLVHKYSPEDLMIYLLDFKTGGVEFNRYRSVKHLKALLVDNSDIQITIEILRSIISQMEERGKMLRESGVSNIVDYNKIHSSNRMPSIVVAVDECHVLYKQDNNYRNEQKEISDIISRISREGGSQGVHLLMATQTLAGTEISVDVTNNITDYFLLNCSPSDSEKLVSGSSFITSKLTQGMVYYHHADKQGVFKSFCHPNVELTDIIDKACIKADGHRSNGQFYFSGSQLFNIDQNVCEYVGTKGRQSIVASFGKAISLDESHVSITLKNDFCENVLLFGINDQEQVTRATMNLLITLSISNVQKKLGYKFIVFDCLNNDEGKYVEILDEMEAQSLCSVVAGKQRGIVLKQLVDEISNEDVQPTILVILGQERFRELKLDTNLSIEEDLSAGGGLLSGLDFSTPNNANVRTYKDALRFILERGPEIGVHTILQVDKPDKLLFSEYSVSAKDVFSIFKHLIMLRSDENSATRFIDNQIKLETLSGDNDRLRAYYYSDDEDKYTLFTPYSMPTLETLSLIK